MYISIFWRLIEKQFCNANFDDFLCKTAHACVVSVPLPLGSACWRLAWRHLVFMRTHSEQPWRLESSFIQSFLQAFFTLPTVSAAQLTIFHMSPMLRSVSLVTSPQTHLPRRQTQLSPQFVAQLGISGIPVVSAFWHVGPLSPSVHWSPINKHGKLVVISH